jgi:hypothetical protein
MSRQITEISNDPKQRFDIITEDNQTFELKLEYSDQQQGWFYSITFGDVIINGSRIITGLNILRNYQNILPFGISILTDDLSEPIFIDDFATERVKFFLLTEEEVQTIETDFYNN